MYRPGCSHGRIRRPCSQGSAASGATARANDDTVNLFTLIWDNIDQLVIDIYDSTGTPTTWGLDAASDFTANKRIALPDLRGRTLIGMDNMGGIDKALVTAAWADTYMGGGGEPEHLLDTTEMPSHTHTGTIATDGAHTHTIDPHNHGGGSHHHSVTGDEAHSSATIRPWVGGAAGFHTAYTAYSGTIINSEGLTTNNDSAHTHTATINNTGGGLAHNIIQPSLVCNILIRL